MIESTAAKELAMKLRKLWDNDNYVKGIIAFAKTESTDIILILSILFLSEQRNNC